MKLTNRTFLLIILIFSAACNLPAAVPASGGETPDLQATATNAYLPVVTQPAIQTWWQPAVETTWQIELSVQTVDRTEDAELYIIDLFDQDAQTVADLHAEGRKVVCYLSAGSWEDWRSDADQFPEEVIGLDYEGWAGEKWLDIRRIDLLAPIIEARLDLCKAKGFDGVDPDNVDGYTNNTGFPLTAQDQIAFNTWLANEAHARGLAVGLKNDPDQADDLLPVFDWALTEGCFYEDWCHLVTPFIAAGKPVFAIEYTDVGMGLDDFCSLAFDLKINAILKNRELDAWLETCP